MACHFTRCKQSKEADGSCLPIHCAVKPSQTSGQTNCKLLHPQRAIDFSKQPHFNAKPLNGSQSRVRCTLS
eukprot:scaffold69339_cov33-Prasinocladus_malaysianus.AAC.1